MVLASQDLRPTETVEQATQRLTVTMQGIERAEEVRYLVQRQRRKGGAK